MKPAINYLVFAIALLFLAFNFGCERNQGNSLGAGNYTQDLLIGRMRVAIWPEYDDPSLLVIYDGKFEDVSDYPIKTSFLVPKGAVISDACSLSHEGQHFCQLFKTIHKGEYDEVSLLLPYPNFYLSFHTPRFDTAPQAREFTYRIKANHPINTMEVDIQQPLRSTEFNISPTDNPNLTQHSSTVTLAQGFKHHKYTLEDIAKDQESAFQINYLKIDPNPSVDIKFSSMSGPKVWSSPYETQKNIKLYIYILFATGAIGVLTVMVWYLLRRKKAV